MTIKKVFVTGGAGYIGSHTCVELLNAGYEVVVYDNFSNASSISCDKVECITGKKLTVFQGDIRDQNSLHNAMVGCDAVIHFAGLKAVGESVKLPLLYYDNNISGTLSLLEAMNKNHIQTLVFSSSATVYGDPDVCPIHENHPLRATNPYGRSKLLIEDMLRDLHGSDSKWKISILRYFNPVGAHESGLIGEDPKGFPNNLMPFVSQVAIGKRERLSVFGNDYDTKDGSGVRDYIHVVDLARGHLNALESLITPQCEAVNLGTGQGYSVLDLVKTYEAVSGKKIPYRIVSRREGDIGTCYADVSKAKKVLNWEAKFELAHMCRDSWNWQVENPNGYS